ARSTRCLWFGERGHGLPHRAANRQRSRRSLPDAEEPVARVGTQAVIDGRHDSLATQYRDQCQDTGSRFVGSVPSYQLVWIAVSYSRRRPLALPMSAEWPPAEATTTLASASAGSLHRSGTPEPTKSPLRYPCIPHGHFNRPMT